MAIPMSAALLGSCTDAPTGAMLVCEEKLFTVVVPSRSTSAVKAKPSVELMEPESKRGFCQGLRSELPIRILGRALGSLAPGPLQRLLSPR